MARKPYITRTMQSENVTVMLCDTETAEVFNETVTLGHTFKDSKAREKAVRAKVETGTVKLVDIVHVETETCLYGISEDDFLTYAKKLNPETRKPIAE